VGVCSAEGVTCFKDDGLIALAEVKAGLNSDEATRRLTEANNNVFFMFGY
jgi:hypothetical protein